MRTIAIGVVLVLAATQGVASEAFKDVPNDHWAAGAVQKLKDEGILRGYPDGTLKGDQPVTRYELAAALVRFVEFFQEAWRPLRSEKQPQSIRSCTELVEEGFLPKDTVLSKDTRKPVTSQELADALASLAKRLIELKVPAETAESPPAGADYKPSSP